MGQYVTMTIKVLTLSVHMQLSMSVAIDILKLFQFKPANEVATAAGLVSVFGMVCMYVCNI